MPWNKFKRILRLWLEFHIVFSKSKLIYGRLYPGLETALRTQKSFLLVLNMGLGSEYEVSKLVKVRVQRIAFLKAVLLFYCPVKL